MLNSYKTNRDRIIDAGYNLLEYEGGLTNFSGTYTRRWQQVLIFQHLSSDAGAIYHGTLHSISIYIHNSLYY